MVSLMQRRRMMMQAAGASPSGPLYQLKQGVSSFTGRNTTVTGNNVVDKNTSGSTGARNMYLSDTYGGNTQPTATWFTLHSGDVVTLKWKNISYTNYYTSGSSSTAFGIRNTSGTSIIAISISLTRNTTGTFADQETTVTLASDENVAAVTFYMQRKSDVTSDIEMWVNGIRYI